MMLISVGTREYALNQAVFVQPLVLDGGGHMQHHQGHHRHRADFVPRFDEFGQGFVHRHKVGQGQHAKHHDGETCS